MGCKTTPNVMRYIKPFRNLRGFSFAYASSSYWITASTTANQASLISIIVYLDFAKYKDYYLYR